MYKTALRLNLHCCCCCFEAKYEAFSRSSAEKDFLSIPSIILENLCWEIEPLQRISRHCEVRPIFLLTVIICSFTVLRNLTKVHCIKLQLLLNVKTFENFENAIIRTTERLFIVHQLQSTRIANPS